MRPLHWIGAPVADDVDSLARRNTLVYVRLFLASSQLKGGFLMNPQINKDASDSMLLISWSERGIDR